MYVHEIYTSMCLPSIWEYIYEIYTYMYMCLPSIWEILFWDSFSVIFCSHSILDTCAFFSASM